MRYLIIFSFTVLLFATACGDDEPAVDNQVLNLSDDFAVCNSNLNACINGNGSYCLFGYKWGEGNPFSNPGYNAPGPESPGGVLSYSFQEDNGVINTHAQINLPTLSFASLPDCARDQIRKALQDWAAVANISFQEFPDNSETDIRFFVADIRQSGVGYPNFSDDTCSGLGGNVVIKNNVSIRDCQQFYLFVLHEIGHVLGLGHVSTYNIMNPETIRSGIEGLQEGDVKGITEIYGVE
ncbi:MAG: matrixin family metalloprotease [Bacteroidota bacterium]